MHLQQDILETLGQSKGPKQERNSLYLDVHAWEVGLDARLLQVRDGINHPKYTAPHYTIMRPIVFSRKSLSSA